MKNRQFRHKNHLLMVDTLCVNVESCTCYSLTYYSILYKNSLFCLVTCIKSIKTGDKTIDIAGK